VVFRFPIRLKLLGKSRSWSSSIRQPQNAATVVRPQWCLILARIEREARRHLMIRIEDPDIRSRRKVMGCRFYTGFKMVARDGVEPPTPAFSGLDTAVANLLIPLCFTVFSGALSTVLLEQQWNKELEQA